MGPPAPLSPPGAGTHRAPRAPGAGDTPVALSMEQAASPCPHGSGTVPVSPCRPPEQAVSPRLWQCPRIPGSSPSPPQPGGSLQFPEPEAAPDGEDGAADAGGKVLTLGKVLADHHHLRPRQRGAPCAATPRWLPGTVLPAALHGGTRLGAGWWARCCCAGAGCRVRRGVARLPLPTLRGCAAPARTPAAPRGGILPARAPARRGGHGAHCPGAGGLGKAGSVGRRLPALPARADGPTLVREHAPTSPWSGIGAAGRAGGWCRRCQTLPAPPWGPGAGQGCAAGGSAAR